MIGDTAEETINNLECRAIGVWPSSFANSLDTRRALVRNLRDRAAT